MEKMINSVVAKMGSMANFAAFLRDVIKENPKTFRVFGPDETHERDAPTGKYS